MHLHSLVQVGLLFFFLSKEILVSATSCQHHIDKCTKVLEREIIQTKHISWCRVVAKLLNCIQVHCNDSLTACEMDKAREKMRAKLDETGIGCESPNLLAPSSDSCGSHASSSNIVRPLYLRATMVSAARTNTVAAILLALFTIAVSRHLVVKAVLGDGYTCF